MCVWAKDGSGMQPVFGNSGLDQAEAEEDGTALIGYSAQDQSPQQEAERRALAQRVGSDWNRISSRIAELYAVGVPENDPRTQQVVEEHYQWLRHFWTPDRDSYLRLAQMYVNQPKFRKRIERRKPNGIAEYLRDAMTAYAWARLR